MFVGGQKNLEEFSYLFQCVSPTRCLEYSPSKIPEQKDAETCYWCHLVHRWLRADAVCHNPILRSQCQLQCVAPSWERDSHQQVLEMLFSFLVWLIRGRWQAQWDFTENGASFSMWFQWWDSLNNNSSHPQQSSVSFPLCPFSAFSWLITLRYHDTPQLAARREPRDWKMEREKMKFTHHCHNRKTQALPRTSPPLRVLSHKNDHIITTKSVHGRFHTQHCFQMAPASPHGFF